MTTTGERYHEARRILLQQARPTPSARVWVAVPDLSDEAIRAGTGRGWEDRCDLIDGCEARTGGHQAIATYVRDEHAIDAWWAQGVTVGYERITGLRLPHQMADGTFTANKSRTVTVDATALWRALLENEERRHLLPDVETVLRSRDTAKAIRLAIGGGVVTITLEEVGSGRVKVVVEHKHLQSIRAVEEWKFYWNDWLEVLDDDTAKH